MYRHFLDESVVYGFFLENDVGKAAIDGRGDPSEL